MAMAAGKSLMAANPLLRLHEFGQSVWLDYIQRDLIENGGLERLIREDGLAGMTSNPAIFEKAIAGGHEYQAPIRELVRRGLTVAALYEALALEDVARAADLFRPLYEETQGGDDFVSIEVSPHLARDTGATIAEAQRLWAALGRPNVMIKVPATRESLPAIRTLIAAGVNVNVTLLFSVARYREVAEAWMAGLEDRARSGAPPGRVASVASARLAYQAYQRIMAEARWQALARQGARAQRLLWARPAPKTRPTATRCMSSRSSAGRRSTRSRPRRSPPIAITAIRRRASRTASRPPARCHWRCAPSVLIWTRSRASLRRRASASLSSLTTSCSPRLQPTRFSARRAERIAVLPYV